MSKTVNVTFTTEKVDNNDNIKLAGYTVALFKDNQQVGETKQVDDENSPVEFEITNGGSYHVEVARVNENGTPFQTPTASEPFQVPAEQVRVPKLVKVTITDVGPDADRDNDEFTANGGSSAPNAPNASNSASSASSAASAGGDDKPTPAEQAAASGNSLVAPEGLHGSDLVAQPSAPTTTGGTSTTGPSGAPLNAPEGTTGSDLVAAASSGSNDANTQPAGTPGSTSTVSVGSPSGPKTGGPTDAGSPGSITQDAGTPGSTTTTTGPAANGGVDQAASSSAEVPSSVSVAR